MARPTFFARWGLLILVACAFLVPFAVRGARFSLQGMKNDVKDWLPKDFQETKDLDEFRRYFLSEQFVLVSWDGCRGDADDQRFQLFTAKLVPEIPPSQRNAAAPSAYAELEAALHPPAPSAAAEATAEEAEFNPTRYLQRDTDFVGDRLGLYYAGSWYENWGHRNEKWLKGLRLKKEGSNEECWYFITPGGDLYRWEGVDSPFAALAREAQRSLAPQPVEGTLIHSFGVLDGPWYYAQPRRLRASLFKTLMTGPDVLASLTRDGGELADDPAEAQRRLTGTLFGPDGKTTCMMLTLTDAARRNLHLVLGRGVLGKPRGQLYEIAAEANIAEEELRMGGPPVDNVAIDEEGSITLVRLISYCAVLGIGLSLFCFRSISLTGIIFSIAAVSAVTSLAYVWWLGSTADAIVMSMPAMIYVLALSGAAHIINYYHEAVEHSGHVGAPEHAVRQGWKPAFLCEVTTAIGLVTLLTSELVPIQKFGLFSALGVMTSFVILLTFLPAALQFWPQKPRPRVTERPWLDRQLAGIWDWLAGAIIRHHAAVAIGCTLLIAGVGYGLVHMRTSVNMLKMFHSEAKIIRDYTWLEANLGNLVPMEVVVRVPKQNQRPSYEVIRELQEEAERPETTPARQAEIQQILHEAEFQLSFLERMELAARVQSTIEEEFGPRGRQVVGQSLSMATFVRPLPPPSGSFWKNTERNTTSGRLEAHLSDFLHSDYLRITTEDQAELWRVSLRVAATERPQSQRLDYGAFISTLQETVEPIVAAQHTRESILRQIDAQRRQAGQADLALAGSQVLLVGVPAELNAAGADADQGQSPAAALAQDAPIDQQRIFVRTLRDMLTASRIKLEVVPAGATLPAEFAETAASQDCIVLVGDLPAADLSRIRSGAKLVIDARDHKFLPQAGQQTAYHQDPGSVSAVYTGIVPIVYKAQRMLLDSLIQSTFWSIITITPLLMWIARSFSAGIVSMLPNILPILMVFGGMGWLGIEVDVGSMMTASIALGVAVDDTIHYLNWFREELDRVGDRKKAILAAYKHCATPTLQAALISGLGLSVFATSTFAPTQRFGVLMLVILWLGVVAELIYFPAMLAGPLGMVFKPRKRKNADGGEAETRTESVGHQLQVVHPDEAPELERELSPAELAASHRVDEAGDALPLPHLPGKTAPTRGRSTKT